MTTRLILGACILAQVAHAQSVAKPSLARATTQHETETGSWRAGDAMVWVRVAPTGAISVYASHGYRSAFAHAITITPEDADKWAEIGDHLLAGQTTSGPVMLADSDLAIEPTRAGDSVVLAVRLGGVRPDGITFLMNGQSIREVTPILRATAKASRSTEAANAAPPPTAPAPAPAPAPTAAAPTPVAPAAAAPTPAAQQPPQPHTAAISTPAAPPEVAAADTPPAPAPEAEVASVSSPTPVVSAPPAVAAPAVVAPAPAVVAPAPAVVAPAPTVAPSKPVQVATTAPAPATPATFTPAVATTKVVKMTQTKLVSQSTETASLRRTSAGSIAKPVAATTRPAEATDATTKLSQSTVANLVKQWQSQLDLCYSEYGLKVNPALTGSIAVRLAIRPTGDVAAATFTQHKWSGAGGTEAESCMRARAMSWMFPPASTPSAHEFTVAFAP